MQFATSSISLARMIESGSCQAVRVIAAIPVAVDRVPVTPEWLAENAAKQRAYKRKRARRLKKLGIITTK